MVTAPRSTRAACRRNREATTEADAPRHRKTATSPTQTSVMVEGCSPRSSGGQQHPGDEADGHDPPGPAGDDARGVLVARDLPDQRLEHPPPVQRQPGHEVEHADEDVAHRRAEEEERHDRLDRAAVGAPADQLPSGELRDQGERQVGQRADDRHHRGRAGGAGPAERGVPAPEVDDDLADLQPERAGRDGVGRLVHQDGHRQQHREGGARPPTTPARAAGPCPCWRSRRRGTSRPRR